MKLECTDCKETCCYRNDKDCLILEVEDGNPLIKIHEFRGSKYASSFEAFMNTSLSKRHMSITKDAYQGLAYDFLSTEYNVSKSTIRQILYESLRKYVIWFSENVNMHDLDSNDLLNFYELTPQTFYILSKAKFRTRSDVVKYLESGKRLEDLYMMGEVRKQEVIDVLALDKFVDIKFSFDVNDMNLPLPLADLSTRAYNCLARQGFRTRGDVVSFLVDNPEGLSNLKHMGKKSYIEIIEKLNLGAYIK
jgi:hypothetical protein